MAITIIKGGKNEFLGHCKWCGCDFRYTAEDVAESLPIMNVINCPFCIGQLQHHGEHGTSSSSPNCPQWATQAQLMQGAGAETMNILDKPSDREFLAMHLAGAGPLLWVAFSDKAKAPWLAAADQAIALYGGLPPVRLDTGWEAMR